MGRCRVITRLKGSWRGLCFDLYVMLDIFSRKAIRCEVRVTEAGDLAKESASVHDGTAWAIHARRLQVLDHATPGNGSGTAGR